MRTRPPPTSESPCLQLLVPDDGWGDPQLLSNTPNLLDVFMEKNNTEAHDSLNQGEAKALGQRCADGCMVGEGPGLEAGSSNSLGFQRD